MTLAPVDHNAICYKCDKEFYFPAEGDLHQNCPNCSHVNNRAAAYARFKNVQLPVWPQYENRTCRHCGKVTRLKILTDHVQLWVCGTCNIEQPYYDLPKAQQPRTATQIVRERVIGKTEQAVLKDRAATHGDAEDSFTRLAAVWSARIGHGVTLKAHQVAIMLADLKGERAWDNPQHEDNWADGAGYYICGASCAAKEGQ